MLGVPLGRLHVRRLPRLLTLQVALGQRRALGEAVSFDELPYFFSDQYDLGMEFFGHVGEGAVAQLEPVDGEAFSCWWRRDGRLVAAMHVNQWDRSDELRGRVASGS